MEPGTATQVATTNKRIIVIGGGLAALAASTLLVERGFRVTLLERKPFLGGRATSYAVNPSEDEYVDNCQHVLLKCCRNLIDFYNRIGVLDGIRFFDQYIFLDTHGECHRIYGSPLPAPLHLAPSFFRFDLLQWKDKIAIIRAMASVYFQKDAPELDRITMLQWLRDHRQTEKAIAIFWRPILTSALNEDIELASARYGLKVFLDGFLKDRSGFHMGVPSVPLSKLYTEPCLAYLEQRGASVRMRSTVSEIQMNGHRAEGVRLQDGTFLHADCIISTVPPEALLKIMPEEHRHDLPFLKNFESSPITAVYFWFDKSVTSLDYAALVGTEIQWMFNKGDHLGLVISASRKLLPLGRSEIIDLCLHELTQMIPEVRNAKLTKAVVIKEPFATFSVRAGMDQFRPDQKTAIANFFLAGDWTKTEWPPTMEGAVISGYRCADLIFAL